MNILELVRAIESQQQLELNELQTSLQTLKNINLQGAPNIIIFVVLTRDGLGVW